MALYGFGNTSNWLMKNQKSFSLQTSLTSRVAQWMMFRLRWTYIFLKDANAPYQILVYVHGRSFTSGDKRKGSGIIDIPAMTERGYAVAAINYRLMPEHPFPAEVIDAKCAIRFLRAHAGGGGLDGRPCETLDRADQTDQCGHHLA